MQQNSVIITSLKLWLRLLLASVFCFVVWASVFALGTSLCAKVVGYRIYEIDESGAQSHLVTEYRYAAGEEVNIEDIRLTEDQSLFVLRENSPRDEAIIGCVSMAFTLAIYGVFPYSVLWRMGSHDENYVQLGRMKKDILFGFKVGSLTTLPLFVLYIMLVLGKFSLFNGVIIKWFRVLNTAFVPYLDAVYAGAETAGELSIGSLLAAGVVVLFVPVLSGLAYWLGYKQISLRERLVYKKKG